jgi:16S rRNA (guanine527-N7)-methyltransferase
LSNHQQLIDLLEKYRIPAVSETGGRFLAYLALLEKWSRRFNLVGSLSWSNLGALLEEGLWAGEKYTKKPQAHLDIGSGAGFPAIPMRIINPAMRLQMVESRAKRAIFLESACASLGLTEVLVHNCTLRAFLQRESSARSWDCVSWKALKLKRKDFVSLVNHSKSGTDFWAFHGAEVPVEGGEIDSLVGLCRRDSAPARRNWRLSIYRKTE